MGITSSILNLLGKGAGRVTSAQLMDMIKNHEKMTIVDVRSPEELSEGRIPGSVLIPLKDLKAMKEFPFSGKIVLYCAAGVRSRMAASALISKGVKDVVDLIGGMHEWKKSGGRVDYG